MLERMFSEETLAEAWQIMVTQFPLAIWETVYVTILATAFAIVLGLPLGVPKSRCATMLFLGQCVTPPFCSCAFALWQRSAFSGLRLHICRSSTLFDR